MNNEHYIHPRFRLGWHGPTHKATLDFGKYLTGSIPEYPPSVDDMSNVRTWCGPTNYDFGTCGPCSVANLIVMSYMYLMGEQITVADDDIFDFYRRSGNPTFNPGTDVGDNGVDTAVMLAELQNGNGITITHSTGEKETVNCVVFGKLNGTGQNLVDQIRASTALFGGVILGVALQVAQQSQTAAKPPIWTDIPSSPDWGGHDVFGGAYTGDEGNDQQVISWLLKVGVSDQFIRDRVQEVFVVVPKIALQHPPILAGIDWATLAADFKQLTDRDFPVDPSRLS